MPTHCFKCAVSSRDTMDVELYNDGHSDITVDSPVRDGAVCIVLSKEDTDRLRGALNAQAKRNGCCLKL